MSDSPRDSPSDEDYLVFLRRLERLGLIAAEAFERLAAEKASAEKSRRLREDLDFGTKGGGE